MHGGVSFGLSVPLSFLMDDVLLACWRAALSVLHHFQSCLSVWSLRLLEDGGSSRALGNHVICSDDLDLASSCVLCRYDSFVGGRLCASLCYLSSAELIICG